MANPSSLPTSGKFPSLFDRADGITPGMGGVAEPAGALKINTSNGNTPTQGLYGSFVPFFYEMSDSPEIESAEQSTIVHKFNCDYNTAQRYMVTNPRGTYLTDQYGNTSRVLSTRISPVPKTGMRGVILTMTSEGQYPMFPNLPNEFDVEIVELNPAAEKHPRYACLTYAQRYLVRNADIVDNKDLSRQYIQQINNISASIPPGTETPSLLNQQLSASLELLYKKHKREDSFYLAGYKVTWTRYFWYPQLLNPGGYIEDPVSQGGLPYFFWSTTGQENGPSIFSQTALYNGNLYPQTGSLSQPPYGLSWQRQADTQHLNRTWWRLTSTWLGAPIGHWDNEWYNKVNQPYQTSEDQGVVEV